MLGLEEWMEVKDLYRQSHSIKHICRQTGYSRNTVRKMLREAGSHAAAAPLLRFATPRSKDQRRAPRFPDSDI